MTSLVINELIKTIRKPRTYISFVVLAVLVMALQLGFHKNGEEIIQLVTQQLETDFEINGTVLTSNFICFLVLQMLIIQMPLLATIVSGDIISGETMNGSLRYLLIRPQSRTKIYFSKWIASMLYTIILILWLGVLAWIVPKFLFPDGDIISATSDSISIIRAEDCGVKFLQAFILASLALGLITSFALMLSAWTDNSIAPIMIVMSVVVIFTVIGTFDLPVYDTIKPFMFTTHMLAWRSLFENPVPWKDIFASSAVLIFHIILFTGLGWYIFNKKDITC
jgi:ABC-2 type transport system permease protein